MNINTNEIITFHDNSQYLVLANIVYNNLKYYYLIEVTEDGEDIKDHIKIMKEQQDSNRTILVAVSDSTELEIVSKLLSKELENNDLEAK